jgi:hypothetical protein
VAVAAVRPMARPISTLRMALAEPLGAIEQGGIRLVRSIDLALRTRPVESMIGTAVG